MTSSMIRDALEWVEHGFDHEGRARLADQAVALRAEPKVSALRASILRAFGQVFSPSISQRGERDVHPHVSTEETKYGYGWLDGYGHSFELFDQQQHRRRRADLIGRRRQPGSHGAARTGNRSAKNPRLQIEAAREARDTPPSPMVASRLFARAVRFLAGLILGTAALYLVIFAHGAMA